MTFQWAAGLIAFACSLISIWPAVRDIRAGVAHPSPVGWLIFAAECAVFTTSLALAGGRAQLGLPAAETLGCTVVAVLAWRAAQRRSGQALDDEEEPRWVSVMIITGVAVALAVVTASAAGAELASPVQATCLLIGVDLVAGAVVVNRVAHQPDAESPGNWAWYLAGECFATVSAIGSAWIFWASSLSGAAVAAAILLTAWRGGVTVKLPGRAAIAGERGTS